MLDTIYGLLRRIGYPHPIHPTEVHIPIGLLVGALVFRLGASVFNRPELNRTAYQCAVLALVFLVPTVLFGVMDWQHFYGGMLTSTIKVKIWLTVLLVVVVAAMVVRSYRMGKDSAATSLLYVAAFLLVVVIGYFGGDIVYGRYSN